MSDFWLHIVLGLGIVVCLLVLVEWWALRETAPIKTQRQVDDEVHADAMRQMDEILAAEREPQAAKYSTLAEQLRAANPRVDGETYRKLRESAARDAHGDRL